jgi:murein DD-endopeptidase MepM/ murein hydrolase activator NlpD
VKPLLAAPIRPEASDNARSLRDSLERRRGDSPEKIRAAAAEFESIFVTQMFKAMRKTVPEGGITGGGFGGRVYQEMLDGEYARLLSVGGGLGLGQSIARELGGEAAARASVPESAASSVAPTSASAPWLRGAQGATLADSVHGAAWDAAGAWPAPGRVTSGFGVRSDPLTGERSFHSGIDLATPAGSTVCAVRAGRVVRSGTLGGYGRAVTIDHGDRTSSLYAHNAELLVAEGTFVGAGTPIAISGSTGRSTGPHVHFEVRKDGIPVDPRAYVSGGR